LSLRLIAHAEGWKHAFAVQCPVEREMLLHPFSPNDFDAEDWKW
jgi:hypothetical protein